MIICTGPRVTLSSKQARSPFLYRDLNHSNRVQGLGFTEPFKKGFGAYSNMILGAGILLLIVPMLILHPYTLTRFLSSTLLPFLFLNQGPLIKNPNSKKKGTLIVMGLLRNLAKQLGPKHKRPTPAVSRKKDFHRGSGRHRHVSPAITIPKPYGFRHI